MASAPSTPKAGWEVKTLGEACEMYQPKTISKKEMDPNGEFPVFGANGIIGRYSKFNHEDPELLITCRGATCGAVNVSLPRSWINGNAMVVRPKSDSLKLTFLKYLFTGGHLVEEAISGAAQPQITRTSLKPLQIPVPPLAEQERIVGILDEAFEGIAAATAQAEKNLHNARELFQSVLQSTFSQKGDDWVETTLKEVCSKIGSGATPRGGKNAYKTEGISLIRSLNVYDREFRDAKLAFIDQDQADKLSNVVVEEGDVLLNITGASVARCCVAPAEHLPARVNQHVSIIRTLPGTSIPSFLNQLLTSKEYKDQLLGIGNKGGATRQAITKVEIQDFKIAFPPLPTQQAIVEKLDALSEETKALEAIYERKKSALAELKQSLLQKAFAGEL
jgi:type I restriction enzyme S subunit